MADFEKLRVPDPIALASVQKLCDKPQPYQSGEEIDLLFIDAMKEVIRWHYDRCGFYKNLLDSPNFIMNDVAY